MDQIYQEIAVLRDKIADFLQDGKKKLNKTELKELNSINKELITLIDNIVSWSFTQKTLVDFRMGRKLLTYLRNLSYQPQTKEFYGQINLARKAKEYQIITRIGFDHSSNFFSMFRGEIFFHTHPYYSTYGRFEMRPYSPPSEADIYAAYLGIVIFPLLTQKELIITPEGMYVIEPQNMKKMSSLVEYKKELREKIKEALKKPLDAAFRTYYYKIYEPIVKEYDKTKNKEIIKKLAKKTESHAQRVVKDYNKVMDSFNLGLQMSYYPWSGKHKKMEYILKGLIPLGAQPRGTWGIYGMTEKEFEGYSQTRPRQQGGQLGAITQLVSN